MAGLACYRPGHRSRLIYRLHCYRGRKDETKAFTWTEYRDLLIAAHRQLPGGMVVLVWDNLNVHRRAELRAFTDAQAWPRRNLAGPGTRRNTSGHRELKICSSGAPFASRP